MDLNNVSYKDCNAFETTLCNFSTLKSFTRDTAQLVGSGVQLYHVGRLPSTTHESKPIYSRQAVVIYQACGWHFVSGC